MTPAGEVLAAEIRERGPLASRASWRLRSITTSTATTSQARDPFGKEGDFYTASQLQPVFGRLVAAAIRQCRGALGEPPDFTVVEWGAGRGEMAAGSQRVPTISRSTFRSVAACHYNLKALCSRTNSSTHCRWTWPAFVTATSLP